jgi:beta-aspartyl-dipeptidase (metallo-type)
LRVLIDEFEVRPGMLYPTHIERGEDLMREAIDLNRRGVFVDIDTVNEDLPEWLGFFLENGGDVNKLTVSSDASVTSPDNLYDQVRACIVEHGFAIEQVLKIATANTSEVLKLDSKGRLKPGRDADALVLREGSLEIKDVIVGGKRMVKNGRPDVVENFLEGSNRRVSLHGRKA